MSEIFTVSPVRLRPAGAGEAVVESGDRRLTVPVGRQPSRPPEKEEEEEPLVRTGNPDPTFGVRMLRDDEVVAEASGERAMDVSSPEDVATLDAWMEREGAAGGRLDIDVDAGNLSDDDLSLLLELGNQRDMAIDLNLRRNG